jgi:hypothetical protein
MEDADMSMSTGEARHCPGGDCEPPGDDDDGPPPPPPDPCEETYGTLTVTPGSIDQGQSVTVQWSVLRPSECEAPVRINGVAQDLSGSFTEAPAASKSYVVTVLDRTLARRSVTVVPTLPLPPTCGVPPYQTPVYTRPADDQVAFESLLEGAGYGSDGNSNWTDLAAGNLCGGSEKELVLLKNQSSNFSILRGPTPYAIAAFDSASNAAHPWRAIAAGNLDADAYDEIVAVRKVAANGVADVVVLEANAAACDGVVSASAAIGSAANSEWVDVAIGNFDSAGKQVALLRAASPSFTLARLTAPGVLTATWSSDLDSDGTKPWRALAAGDLDGDGRDELVAARRATGGTTVIAYKWNGTTFLPLAASTFGNTGNSEWSSMAIGDFNGDGRPAIALVKNAHSNFAMLDLPAGAGALRVLATSDLDSAGGQSWRGLAATDWLGTDQGARELVAVRAAQAPYRADLFVYGSRYHRVMRDTALDGMKGMWDQPRLSPDASESDVDAHIENLKRWIYDSRINTVNWFLGVPGDYIQLVKFLRATRNACVDGKQLRVMASMWARRPGRVDCFMPEESELTAWSELDEFDDHPGTPICDNQLGWSTVLGRLAQEYPQLIGFQLDDFMNQPYQYPGDYLAEMQSRMRSRAPWLTLTLQAYYANYTEQELPDIAHTADSILMYFRNESHGRCLAGTCGERSVPNVVEEIAYVRQFLPAGRKLQVGTYWDYLWDGDDGQRGTSRYVYDLTRLILNLPDIAGVTAYPMTPRASGLVCNEYNFLDDKEGNNQDDFYRYCTLRKVYRDRPRFATHTDLTAASGAPLAAGDPSGFVYESHGVQNAVYRGFDGHAHELWRSATAIGHSNLTALAGAPPTTSEPKGYVYQTADVQSIVYRGNDGNVHGLYWSTGAVGHDNLSGLAGAPDAVGEPYPYIYDYVNMQNVLYRGVDGHVHGLYWALGPVGHDDLSGLSGAPNAAGNPFPYVFPLANTQNALYLGDDGHLHGLYWELGPVGDDDLTALSGAPPPQGRPSAYVAPAYGTQNAVYRGVDQRLHALYWSLGGVGHDDLTDLSHASQPAGDPAGYFVAADGTQHVVYRGTDGQIHDLWWTVGAVTHDYLSLMGGAPPGAGDPSVYVRAADGTEHVLYRSADGHIQELMTRTPAP